MVKRYDFQEGNEETIIERVECADGDWVSFDDYDRLRAEVEKLRADLKEVGRMVQARVALALNKGR